MHPTKSQQSADIFQAEARSNESFQLTEMYQKHVKNLPMLHYDAHSILSRTEIYQRRLVRLCPLPPEDKNTDELRVNAISQAVEISPIAAYELMRGMLQPSSTHPLGPPGDVIQLSLYGTTISLTQVGSSLYTALGVRGMSWIP